MANSDLLMGSIVKLSPDHKWYPNVANPVDCTGEVYDKQEYVYVKWHNGHRNCYKASDTDLILIESP